MGEGGRRNRAVIDAAAVAQDVVHGHGALGGGGVGQHHFAGDIAHGPEVGHGRPIHQHPHLVIHGDEAPVGLHRQGPEVELLAHRHPAGGHQHRIHLQGFDRLPGGHVHQLDPHR